MRRKWQEVWILPLVSCHGAGARLGTARLTFVCLAFSVRETEVPTASVRAPQGLEENSGI